MRRRRGPVDGGPVRCRLAKSILHISWIRAERDAREEPNRHPVVDKGATEDFGVLCFVNRFIVRDLTLGLGLAGGGAARAGIVCISNEGGKEPALIPGDVLLKSPLNDRAICKDIDILIIFDVPHLVGDDDSRLTLPPNPNRLHDQDPADGV